MIEPTTPTTEERIESCQDCGIEQPCVWTAPDELWEAVMGRTDGGGVVCPRCFEERAAGAGVGLLRWVPERIDAWRTLDAYVRSQNADLREAATQLAITGVHSIQCLSRRYDDQMRLTNACDCGWDAALAGFQAALDGGTG